MTSFAWIGEHVIIFVEFTVVSSFTILVRNSLTGIGAVHANFAALTVIHNRFLEIWIIGSNRAWVRLLGSNRTVMSAWTLHWISHSVTLDAC